MPFSYFLMNRKAPIPVNQSLLAFASLSAFACCIHIFRLKLQYNDKLSPFSLPPPLISVTREIGEPADKSSNAENDNDRPKGDIRYGLVQRAVNHVP